MDKFFKIKERGSTVRIEILGGVTTFFAMAYIIFVNPNMLATFNPDLAPSIFTATCISAAIGTLLTGLMANAPFAQAPGMGLNSFFAFTVATAGIGFGMGYTFNQALAIVFLSGVLFLLIMITPLRKSIISAIPSALKSAIGGGIGLFIAFIGFINSGNGIIKLDGENHITGLNLTVNGALNMHAAVTIIGLIIIACLLVLKVKGAIFIGIIAATLLGIPMGVTTLPSKIFDISSITLAGTAFKLDFSGLMSNGALVLVTAIVSFLIVDMFDTIGTLIGTASANNMVDKDGNMQGADRALIADAIATCCGALLGTSTVTTYIESSTGISQGARTGLSSVTVAVLFIVAIIFAPIALMIPGAATAPALIIVGVFMLKGVAKIDWNNLEDAIPSFLTIVIMPFCYSISDGIAFGFISYVLLKVIRGKFKDVPVAMYVISGLFVVMYILKALAA